MADKLNLAILIPITHPNKKIGFLSVGGSETWVLKIMEFFETQPNLNMALMTKYTEFHPKNNRTQIFQSLHANKRFGGFPPYYMFRTFLDLLYYNRSHPIDVINPHMFSIGAIPAIIAKKLINKPIFISTSQNLGDLIAIKMKGKHPIIQMIIKTGYELLFHFLAKNVDYFQALNSRIKKELIVNYHIPPERIFIVPTGAKIDPSRYKPDLSQVKTFGYFGRLNHEKNLMVLFKAFKLVQAEFKDIQFVLFGQGPEEKRILKFIHDNNLTANFTYKGYVLDRESIYTSFDCFILPSKGEGISLSLLEAMAHGNPVIASKVVGNYDVIQDHQNGLLYSPFSSPEKLAEKMKELILNPSLAKKLKENAWKDVNKKYALEVVGNNLIGIFNSIKYH